MWVGVRWQFYSQNEGPEMYFWGKGTSCPSQTWMVTSPAPHRARLRGFQEPGATHWSKIFSADQQSLLLRPPTQVPHCPGTSSRTHCHLPNLIGSLGLCCHLHAEELARDSGLLSAVSQEAPYSLTSLLNKPPHLPDPAPSPCSLWIPNILHYGFFRGLYGSLSAFPQ